MRIVTRIVIMLVIRTVVTKVISLVKARPAGEGEGDRLLHLYGDGLLLLVHVSGLGELDVAGADVAGGGELNSLLGAGDHHGLAELGQVPGGRRGVQYYTTETRGVAAR